MPVLRPVKTFVAGTIITTFGRAKKSEGRTVPNSDWGGSEFANGRNRPTRFSPGRATAILWRSLTRCLRISSRSLNDPLVRSGQVRPTLTATR